MLPRLPGPPASPRAAAGPGLRLRPLTQRGAPGGRGQPGGQAHQSSAPAKWAGPDSCWARVGGPFTRRSALTGAQSPPRAACCLWGPDPPSPPTNTPVPGPQHGARPSPPFRAVAPGMPLGSTGCGRPVPSSGAARHGGGGAQVGRRPPGRAGQLRRRLNGRSVLLPVAVICRRDSVSWKPVRLQVDSARPGDPAARSPGVSEPGRGRAGRGEQ